MTTWKNEEGQEHEAKVVKANLDYTQHCRYTLPRCATWPDRSTVASPEPSSSQRSTAAASCGLFTAFRIFSLRGWVKPDIHGFDRINFLERQPQQNEPGWDGNEQEHCIRQDHSDLEIPGDLPHHTAEEIQGAQNSDYVANLVVLRSQDRLPFGWSDTREQPESDRLQSGR
jgi:hypothetical protein